MILLRIKIQNFLIYEHVDLNLRDIKLASIIGQFVVDRRRSNGAGKTALLEAIRYALFDQVRSKQKDDVIRNGAKRSSVLLDFIVGAKTYTVVRTREAGGLNTGTLHIDGKFITDKLRVVNETIETALGIDADLFDQIYFFKQGDAFGFAEASPSDRKEALARVFRMESLAKCMQSAKEKHREAESGLERARGTAEALGSRDKTISQYQTLQQEELDLSGDLAFATYLQSLYVDFVNETTLAKADMERLAIDFEKEVTSAIGDADKIQKKLDETSQKIAQMQQKLQRTRQLADAEQEGVKTLQGMLAGKSSEGLAERSAALQKKIDSLLNEITQHTSDIAVHQSNLKRYQGSKTTALAGEICPTCQQVVGVEHAEMIRQNNEKETTRLKKEIESVTAQLTQKQAKYKELLAQRDRDRDIEKYEAAIAGHKNVIAIHEKAIKEDDASLEEMIQGRLKLCAEQSVILQKTDASKIAAERKIIHFHYQQRKNLYDNICQERGKELAKNVERLSAAYADVVSRIEQRKTLDREMLDNRTICLRLQDNCQIYKHLSDAFGKDGMQALLIENVIGIIETFANDILKQMQTRFLIKMRTQKEKKSGELKESLDIMVYDNGSAKQFENYSGGERAMINIALRLALSKVIASLYGVEMNCLFLDEVLAALDEVNREEAVKIIAFLAHSFEQVFIVSHTDEIRSIIDCSIIIERQEDKSIVYVTNSVKEVA